MHMHMYMYMYRYMHMYIYMYMDMPIHVYPERHMRGFMATEMEQLIQEDLQQRDLFGFFLLTRPCAL